MQFHRYRNSTATERLAVLTLRELIMQEPLLLADVQRAVLEFMRGRADAALFDAQAVNAYVAETRMTQEVDILSPRAAELAEELIAHQKRKGRPKSGTDWRDLASLLLTFPELKSSAGPVYDRLEALGADAEMMDAWRDLVAQEILPEDDNEGY